MNIQQLMRNKELNIAVIGIGYVGLPLALSFAEHFHVVGFDIDAKKIEKYRSAYRDRERRGSGGLSFTDDPDDIGDAHVYIVTVPTPVDAQLRPDLSHLIDASRLIGRKLAPGNLVIYESTVYPGVTEEVCIPVLEAESGLGSGADFQVGYSPERVNPGDVHHRLDNTKKIVSALSEEALDTVAELYAHIVEAGVYRVSSIRLAEAAKVTENAQRDMSIAFMNELSMMFHHMGIDTKEVIDACSTKWNFQRVTPGLVGGHCIGVDTYYLIYKSEQLGYTPTFLHAGRTVNESMGRYIANQTIKRLARLQRDHEFKRWTIAVLGVTYKENTDDIRNSKVKDLIGELREFGVKLLVADPLADESRAAGELGVQLCDWRSIRDADAVIVAVPHDEFRAIPMDRLLDMYDRSSGRLLVDIRGAFDRDAAERHQIRYWRL